MTEPLPSTQTPTETLVYQPVSGWAVAGLALGGSFTLLVVLSAAIAFYQGAPLFVPIWLMGPWMILGLALSLFGQRHVQSSEGTRAGAKLAQWGVRLSLISGLMYFSYHIVTGVALQNQANAFVMEKSDDAGFFPRLTKDALDPVELNRAFLLTQPPSSRSGRPESEKSMRQSHDIPREGEAGLLTQFREREMLPRVLFKHLGTDAEITPLAVLKWEYKQRSYQINRAYRIKTKELEMEYELAVFSAEAESAGQGRKWFVNLPQSSVLSLTLTPVGKGMILLRERADQWLNQWGKKLNDGLAVEEIAKLDQTPLSPEDGNRKILHQAFSSTESQRFPFFQAASKPDQPGKWEQVEGKIRAYPIFRTTIPSRNPEQPPVLRVEAIATLESKQPIDPAKFEASSVVDWNLISLDFTALSAPESKTPKNSKPPR